MVRVAVDGRHAPESNPVCVCKHSEQQNMIRIPFFLEEMLNFTITASWILGDDLRASTVD